MRSLFLLLALVLGSVSCETTQVVHHQTAPLPPEIQKAQDAVWDLQFQLYQAQHDLRIAQIAQNEANLDIQRNGNPAAYTAQYTELMSKLALERSNADQRLALAQQWYDAVRSGDMDTARNIQQEMSQQ